MGKRTSEKTEDEIKKKIKRLEKELCRRKPPDSYETEELEIDRDYEREGIEEEAEYSPYEDRSIALDGEAAVERHLLESVVQVPPPPAPCSTTPVTHGDSEAQSVPPQSEENPIPSEILAILGDAKKTEEVLGKNIPVEISERWGKILVEGLIKEQKETLLTKMLIPENFQLAKAPKLNAEVMSVLTEPTKNRDKRCEKLQNQLGSSIAGIANLTSELINKDLNKMDIIRQLSEINQILLDLHYEETMNRRRLIIPLLDKSFINIIQGVKRNKYIFGDNLGENIKTTKSIERTSLQIKKSNISQPTSFRKPTATGIQGNLRTPLRQPSGQGVRAYPPQARYHPPPPPPPSARRPQPPRRPPPPPPPPPPTRPQDRRFRR